MEHTCHCKCKAKQTTTTYTPQQNGKAERLNRTLMEKSRAMLTAANLPESHWGDAVLTANYLRNRSPTVHTDKTPWELFYGNVPDVLCFAFTMACVLHTKAERG